VVETDRGVVFVPQVLPGEEVRIALSTKKGSTRRGRLVALLSRSEDRVEPPCPLTDRCGGCPLMILSASAERALKERTATWAVGVPTELTRLGETLGYRRRARLAWANGGLGYRRAHDTKLVDVPACAVLAPPLGQALDTLRASLLPNLAGRGALQLAMGDGAPVAWLRTDDAQPAAVYGELGALVAGGALVARGALAGAVLAVGPAEASFGDPREVVLGVDGLPLHGPPFGFAQAHETVNAALVSKVASLASCEGTDVVELYAGHGNLSVALAGQSPRSLTAVEQVGAAAVACRDNLAARGLSLKVKVKVVEADAKEGLRRVRRADVVVLDPPRTGARETLEGVLALAPARIVYVSCDAPTLRRDLGVLGAGGYRVVESAAFDMFPQTAHLEMVVLLEPGPPE
jgi:23S rRNA (uracil1939-C5)-methyltransferase